MGKTPPKEKEADGSPRKKAARVDDPALITASAPSPTVKTPPKGKEAEESPQNKAPLLGDAALATVPVASALSPTGKTPPKGEEAEENPRKKALRLGSAALATGPEASELNPTGEAPPKGEAEGSPPKRTRSPQNKSPRRQGIWPAAALPLPTVAESWQLIVEAAGRTSDEKQCKCNHVITYSAIEELVESLDSKDAWTCCGCWDEDKNGIVKTRPAKRDLLICMTCYDHLCCGVGWSIAYRFGHSRAHALKKKHWFAVLYCDPERGYCFKCNAEVLMPVKFGEGDNEVGLQEIRSIVSRKLLATPPSVGQTEAEVNPMVQMTGKVQAETHPSGYGLDLADKWPSRSSDTHGYAIRGIPNLGNTCYMSAVLQCLFVLGKLQERIFALDPPKGLPELLKELFVEASTAGDVLNPMEVSKCVHRHRAPQFRIGTMEDSHEFLVAMRNIWNEVEVIDNRQSDACTVIDSIFRFKMLQTLSCKKCGYSSPTSDFFWDLTMHFPSKWHPTKSAASPQTSGSPRSRKREIAVQLFPADVQRNLEKMQIVSESGYSLAVGSEVTVEETHKPLEVDSTETQCISQSKDVVQSYLQIQEGKSVDSLTEDSISIEDFLSLFSEAKVKWRCPNCPMDHEEPSASQSKNGEQIEGSGNEDDAGDTVQIYRFTSLPPVLALHLDRTSQLKGTDDGIKISGHVRFMEDLDVKRFMDPSSADKGSTLYCLAGVVEHIGKGSLKAKDSHYIAYVRARRLGNQQEGNSYSSSWFRADDHCISQVTLEQVLNCEAYILFYERMEDQDIFGMPEVGEDTISSWEMVQSNEIVNFNTDSEDDLMYFKGLIDMECFQSKLEKLFNIPWSTQLIYNKYIDFAVNVFEENNYRVEWLQQGTEFLGQFSPLLDPILPVPVCSIAASASSSVSQGINVAVFLARTVKLLRYVINPPEYFTVRSVSNEVEPTDIVEMWNDTEQSDWCFVVLDDRVSNDEAKKEKGVTNELYDSE